MTAITLKNIGPIATLALPVPEGGGVVVLRGKNGSGKTTALDAINAAVTGKGKPPLKDLAASGEVIAAGVKLIVGRSVRRAGELEVATLEGRLSVADLVDPGLADPLRADATRIKALVGLSGATLEAADLHGFPAELLDGLALSDPVAAMAELKRRLDIGGREYEKLAKAEADKAAAMLESAGEAVLAPSVENAMAALAESQRRLDRLIDAKSAAVAARAREEEARERLAAIPVIDVAETEEQARAQEDAVATARAAAQLLKEQYNAAVERFKTESAALDVVCERLKAATQAAALRAQLARQLAESSPVAPSNEALAKADQELGARREAMALAERARQSEETRRRGAEKALEAERLAKDAELLRRQARQTDEVFSEIVSGLQGCPLRVSDGRLVIDTARGPTLFAELSHGERWRMALDIAIGAVGKTGLIVIPQEAWEGLDSENRAAVSAQAKAGGVVVITAECGDGELSAEVETG